MQVLSAVASTGSKMTIRDAAVTAILGYAVVFFGLVLLMFVIILFGKVMVASARKKAAAKAAPAPVQEAAAPAPKAEPAPGSAGELKLYNVSDKDAAMIMAIVADKTGKPLNELRFKSIREVRENEI